MLLGCPLPQFVNPEAPAVPQLLVLGASSVAIELGVLYAYAHTAARSRAVAGARAARWLERLGGGLLVAIGARLATARFE